ncbi:MAG: HEAT repeat domain-containing protein [Victivallales bacterium]|nr:HEAT repeat domain-containing protein [Victivallales bacterium]
MANKKTDKAKSANVNELEKLVWADKAVGAEIVDALLADCAKSVKLLVGLLSEKNDGPSVQASFALDGMVMRAMAPDNGDAVSKLAKALDASLKFAKDDTARCIVLKCMQQLACEATIPVFARYLLTGEPMFTYALNALRRIGTEEAYDTIREAMLKAEGRARVLLCAAALESYVVDDELLDYGIECLDEEDDPALIRLLWSRLSVRGVDLQEDLLDALAGLSRVDAGQARRTIFHTLNSREQYVNIDDENGENDECDCHDHDCHDDECECGCDDDDCGCDDDDAYMRELVKNYLKVEPKEPALFAMAMVCGADDASFDILTKAVEKGDKIQRTAAMKLLVCMSNEMAWFERLVGFIAGIRKVEAKADAIRLLGRCNNPVVRPFVMSCLNDKSLEVRAAAIEAADCLPGHNIVGTRLGAIITAGLK